MREGDDGIVSYGQRIFIHSCKILRYPQIVIPQRPSACFKIGPTFFQPIRQRSKRPVIPPEQGYDGQGAQVIGCRAHSVINRNLIYIFKFDDRIFYMISANPQFMIPRYIHNFFKKMFQQIKGSNQQSEPVRYITGQDQDIILIILS